MRRINIMLLLIVTAIMSTYSSGKIEIQDEYVDLGLIKVMIGLEKYEINLPYEKPYGISKVPTKDQTGLVIHELIVDGKIINPKKKYFSTNETIDRLYEEDTGVDKEHRKLKLLWWALGVKPDEAKIKKGLFYETVIGKTPTPEQYVLPYGAKEVFLRYSILYPYDVIKHSSNINLDQEYVVRWTMEWP